MVGIWLDISEGDMLPWVLSSIHIQRVFLSTELSVYYFTRLLFIQPIRRVGFWLVEFIFYSWAADFIVLLPSYALEIYIEGENSDEYWFHISVQLITDLLILFYLFNSQHRNKLFLCQFLEKQTFPVEEVCVFDKTFPYNALYNMHIQTILPVIYEKYKFQRDC